MNKSAALRLHSGRRFAERFGGHLGRATRTEIVAAIRQGRSVPVRRQSHRVSVHDVTLEDGLVVRVVYDRKRHAIVTCLRPEWSA